MSNPDVRTDFTPTISDQTLVFVFNYEGKILLGKRQHDLHTYLFNGYGGRVKQGQSVLENAIIKLRKESGLTVDPKDMIYLGCVCFFDNTTKRRVHIFKTYKVEGSCIKNTKRMIENKYYSKVEMYELIKNGEMPKDAMQWMSSIYYDIPFKTVFVNDLLTVQDIPIKANDIFPINATKTF